MAEDITIARPYAEAVYRLAQGAGTLTAWSDMLALAAAVAADVRFTQVATDPKVPRSQVVDLMMGVCGNGLDALGRNLVQLLAENKRLSLLPQIRDQFERLKSEAEGEVEASIVTAFPLTDAQWKDLVAQLEKRYGRRVQATVRIDPELIGGVTISVGDQIFDASVRGRLEAMAAALKT